MKKKTFKNLKKTIKRLNKKEKVPVIKKIIVDKIYNPIIPEVEYNGNKC
jgi:hypothetical protein